MAPRSRAVARAVLVAAALGRAAAVGEPSCGQDEVCATQDVEAVEEASMDVLRVELLQKRTQLLSAGGSAKEAAPESSLGLTGGASNELAEHEKDTLNASLLQSASGDIPLQCRGMMLQCGCRDIPTDGSIDNGARSDIGTSSTVYKFVCSGNSVCYVYDRRGGIGSINSMCDSGTKVKYYTNSDGVPTIARTCCSGDDGSRRRRGDDSRRRRRRDGYDDDGSRRRRDGYDDDGSRRRRGGGSGYYSGSYYGD